MEFSDVWKINFKKAATKKIAIDPAEAVEMIEGFGQCTRCGGTGKVDPHGPANSPVCPACRKLPIPGDTTRKEEDAELAADWIDEDTSTDWQALQKFNPTSCTVCGITGTESAPYKPVPPHFKSLEIKLRDMVLRSTRVKDFTQESIKAERALRKAQLEAIHNILTNHTLE